MTRVESEYGVYETKNVATTTGQQTVSIAVGYGLFELLSASIYTASTVAAPGTIYAQYPNMTGGNDEQYLVAGYFTEKEPLCLKGPTRIIGPCNLVGYFEIPTSASAKFSAGWRRLSP